MLWACINLPHLAMDGILRRHPVTGPLVLVDGPANARTIVAANEPAHAAGLHVGQRLSAAQALLSQFEAMAYERESADRWHRFLAAVAYRYSSEVSLLPHAIVLEVSRSMGLFGPWPRLEAMLRADFTALGFRHRLAAAPTPHAAQVLATVADGQAVQGADALRRALQGVPLAASGLPAAAIAALPGMGIRRLGQLLALPRDGLRRRFGAELPAALERLTGERPPGLESYRPPDVFDLRIELLHEVENRSALVFPLRRMVDDLAAYLAGRDGGVQRFLLRLEHREGRCTDVPVGLLAPERDGALLFEFARGRLEHVVLPAPVLALRLLARELPAFVPAGRDLFDERPANALPLGQLRERLRARLGERVVYRLGGTTDPRPERAQAVAEGDHGHDEPSPRPTWLLAHPVPLRGPPPRILAGPERLETGWWDGAEACRDYYVVETSLGQRAWAFCPPGEQDGWMLQGWFA
ncbi:DNA polymerase Y family protein [Rhodanobacter denitrificans]|uniref:Y-family DNA polymerase n=1 Tax=Rhodanobacter denitrificans TaxID=666685 RepID=UPI000260CC38|nr:DNA polymerase Y family protein [Rhodanobacter denitrificans]EIM04263.1 nucleotidyltransferase/DNA polymerase involved in DNA repair [Rhodanobacter denitrificans]UJM88976.1 DNA polymerase Y family protein [Rhodanobacter denitrificans]